MTTTKARREAGILVAVVFLLGLLLGGLGNHLWGERVWGMRLASSRPTHRQVMEELAKDLALTPDQEKQIDAISDETRTTWKALYTPLDPQREQIRLRGRERIRALLTPEQQPKFDEYFRHLDQERKKAAATP
jgi:Spy/CpxP family protein refolding chaperone